MSVLLFLQGGCGLGPQGEAFPHQPPALLCSSSEINSWLLIRNAFVLVSLCSPWRGEKKP